MGILEKPLPARGVKLYFVVKQEIREEERSLWQNAISRSTPLAKWFGQVEFHYSDHPALVNDCRGWNLVKVLCTSSNVLVKPSKAESSYNQIFQQFSTWFTQFCQGKGMECKPYDLRILFRLHPPEALGEFVPIPSLDDLVEQVVSPPNVMSIPDPPATPEEMLDSAKMTDVFGGQAVDGVIQHAAKYGWEVYAGYGIRTEEHANTYELDTLVPSAAAAEAKPTRRPRAGESDGGLRIGPTNLSGGKLVSIPAISMLPEGRLATADVTTLVQEQVLVRAVWSRLEVNYPWYKGEWRFGVVPSMIEEAHLWQRTIEDALIRQAKFTKGSVRCPYKVGKLEWQQTLWRFYWLWLIAIEDMQSIWNAARDPINFLSVGARNDHLRDIALIYAIPPGRAMIHDERFDRVVRVSRKVRELEAEAKKHVNEPILWRFPDLSGDRAIFVYAEEQMR